MLKTLENKDVREAESLLASAAQRLLPHPGIASPEDDQEEAEEVQGRLLQEIQADLRMDPTDQSPEAKTKMLEFLYNEMSKPLKSGPRRDQARARLGQKGYLRPDMYRIRFRDTFREREEKYGIRRAHVEDALRAPDHYQHLPLRKAEYDAMSIYAKTHEGSQRNERFTLLVVTKREGDIQLIMSAWRVYHAEVPVASIQEPLEMLRAFVDIYGVPFRVGNSAPAKFFLYEAFLLGQNQSMTNVISCDNPPEEGYASTLLRVSGLHVVEVSFAYMIDMARYKADLRQHHVHISS